MSSVTASAPAAELPTAPSRRRSWWTWFVLLFLACAIWSFSMPLFSPPDEQAHAERAYVIARGHLSGKDQQTVFGVLSEVRVARWLLNLDPKCFLGRYRIRIPASCRQPVADDGGNRTVLIVMGAYGPAYFGLVGLATVAMSGPPAIYVMRVITAAICAALLASAFASAVRLGRWALVGLTVACTPMVFYLASSVNPNGIEIAAAMAIWCSALALVFARDVDERLLARTAIAYAICATSRGLSLPMASLALVAPLVLVDRARLRALMAITRFRLWLGVVIVGAVTSLAFSAWVGVKDDVLPRQSFTFLDGLARTWDLFGGAVAFIGWSELRVPGLRQLWLVVFVFLVATALVRARLREGLVLVGVAILAVVVPIVISMLQLPPIHTAWHGRYGLPITVGIPILSGVLIARHRPRGWRLPSAAPAVIVGVLAVGQVFAFAVASRRYTVGTNGAVLFFADPAWTPPLPSILGLAGLALVVGILAWRVATADADGSEPSPIPAS